MLEEMTKKGERRIEQLEEEIEKIGLKELPEELKEKKWVLKGSEILIPYDLKNNVFWSCRVNPEIKEDKRKKKWIISWRHFKKNELYSIGEEFEGKIFINKTNSKGDKEIGNRNQVMGLETAKNDLKRDKDEVKGFWTEQIDHLNRYQIDQLLLDNFKSQDDLKDGEEKKIYECQDCLKVYPSDELPKFCKNCAGKNFVVLEKGKREIDQEKIKEIKKEVKREYEGNFIDYLMDKSQYLILNEAKNIVKQNLSSFSISIGNKSSMNDIHGRADSGKTYIMETNLDYFVPPEYVIRLNSSTLAGFINQCKENPYYYNEKIIYFGDLGDKDAWERLSPIFNVLKILITEGSYKDSKNEQEGKEWVPLNIILRGICGVFYCTVYEDNNDKTNQIDSRAIFSTPAQKDPKEKILFKINRKTRGTKENAYFTKTAKELESYKEYFRYSIKEYKEKEYGFINPFIMVFNDFLKHGATETREIENIHELFRSYCILNRDICFQFKKTVSKKEIIYLIPKIEMVQKFIHIIYSSVGLKPHERELLLKLKKELTAIDFDKAIEIYKATEKEKDNEEDSYYATDHQLHKATFQELFKKNGLNNEDGNEKYFFKATDIKEKFRNSTAIKNIEDLNSTLINLSNREFIGKFEEKYNRANVYFVNEGAINDITDDYFLTPDDIKTGLKFFSKNLKENPLDANSKNLFNKKEMGKIENNYNTTDIESIKVYE